MWAKNPCLGVVSIGSASIGNASGKANCSRSEEEGGGGGSVMS